MNKNRGMLLETIINNTIQYYWTNNLAYIEKKNLNIKFKNVSKDKTITDGYIANKSTVDYIGCLKGKFIAFEAKSTYQKYLPANNLKLHQKNYLKQIEQNGGISFLIVFFHFTNEFYLLPTFKIMTKWETNISIEEIKKIGFKLELTFPGIIDFLPYIKVN
ncbi:Holliday junction resolvase RecU [Mycoplasmopsis gallinarum]|uniref:Holliday junction resolvase RecU n=1 Tax=Mycoplasmopsis gallinarum TaxID=29557 RepID=UPI0004860842|nr:Holliday junction resolvase RecU [Mycoplasmopsis gallinarum]